MRFYGLLLEQCVTFWYQMLGKGVRLQFLVVNANTTSESSVAVWSLTSKTDTKQWTFGSFSFYSLFPYTIRIESAHGDATTSLALDDVVVRESTYCSLFPAEVPRNPSQATLAPFDCDFEPESVCNWIIKPSDKKGWFVIDKDYRANAFSQIKRPKKDHT